MKLLLPVAALLGCASAAVLPPHSQSGSSLSNRGTALENRIALTARQVDDGAFDDPDSDISDTESVGSDTSDTSADGTFDDDPTLSSGTTDESLGLDDTTSDGSAGSVDDGGFVTLPPDDGTFTINGGDLPAEGGDTAAPTTVDTGALGEAASPIDDTSSLATPVGDAEDPPIDFPVASVPPRPTPATSVPIAPAPAPATNATATPTDGFTLENGDTSGSLNLPPQTVERATCKNPRKRREWRSLTKKERRRYIKAVECMQTKPAVSSKYWPVVKTRYEDFVALHANATGGGIKMNDFHGASSFKDARNVAHMSRWGIHNVGIFLPWHRYTVWQWETVLQQECGWTEGQPYWDWYLDTPDAGGSWLQSPLFLPDAFGGNGKKMNGTLYDNSPKKEAVFQTMPKHSHEKQSHAMPGAMNMTGAHSVSRAANDTKPHAHATMSTAQAHKLGLDMFRHPGTGGGCVTGGPFVQDQLHIGPFGAMYDNKTATPRCLTRNFNAQLAESAASYASISDTLRAKNFGQFRQGVEKPRIQYLKDPKTGNYTRIGRGGDLHTIGHSGVGGEMSDLFNSVNDPIFFLHHANIDRMWWLWQSMDLPKRLKDIKGGPMPRGFPGTEDMSKTHSHGAMSDSAHGAMSGSAHGKQNANATKTHGPAPKAPANRTPLEMALDKIGYPAPLTLESPIWMGFMGPDKPVKAVMDIKGLGNDDEGFLCYDYATGLDVYGIKPTDDGKGWFIPPLTGLPNTKLVPAH